MSKLALRLVVTQNGMALDPANLSAVDTAYPLEISVSLYHGHPNMRLSSYVIHPQILQSVDFAAMQMQQSGRTARHSAAGSGSSSGAGIMPPGGVAPRPVRGGSSSTGGLMAPAPGPGQGAGGMGGPKTGSGGVPQWSASASPAPNAVGTLTNWQPPNQNQPQPQQQQVNMAQGSGGGGGGSSALLGGRGKGEPHINTNSHSGLPPKLGLPSPSSAVGLAALHGLPGSGSNTPVPNSGRDSHRSLGGNNTDRSERERGGPMERERERERDGPNTNTGGSSARAPPGGVTLSSPLGGTNIPVTVLSGGSSGGVASPRPASPSLRNSNASIGSTFSSGKHTDADAVLHRLHRAVAASTSSTTGREVAGAMSSANTDEPGSQTEGVPHGSAKDKSGAGAGANANGNANANANANADDHAHSSSLVPSFFTGDDKEHTGPGAGAGAASGSANPNSNPVQAPSSGKGLALGGLLGTSSSGTGSTATGGAIWESPAFGSLSPSILPQNSAIYSPSLSGQKPVVAPGGGSGAGHHRSSSGHHSSSAGGGGQMGHGHGAGGGGGYSDHGMGHGHGMSPHQQHGSLQGAASGHHSARSPPPSGMQQLQGQGQGQGHGQHHGGGGHHSGGGGGGGHHGMHSHHGAPSPHHGAGAGAPHGMHSPHQSVSHLPSPHHGGGGGGGGGGSHPGASPHQPGHQLMHHPQHGAGGAAGGGMQHHPQQQLHHHGHGHGHGHGGQSPPMGGAGATVMPGGAGGAGGPAGQPWPAMNVITESPLRVCKANELCEDPNCPRMHGEFEPKQDEFFRAYPNEKALQVVCVWNMRGFCRLAERCGYRHLKQLFSHRPLTAAQREKLENPTITKKKYT